MEIPKADTMKLEWEQELIVDNMKYLKGINLYLINQFKEIHNKFINLQSESTKEISKLKEEIHNLRQEIKEIENARSFKFEIPESWIIEE